MYPNKMMRYCFGAFLLLLIYPKPGMAQKIVRVEKKYALIDTMQADWSAGDTLRVYRLERGKEKKCGEVQILWFRNRKTVCQVLHGNIRVSDTVNPPILMDRPLVQSIEKPVRFILATAPYVDALGALNFSVGLLLDNKAELLATYYFGELDFVVFCSYYEYSMKFFLKPNRKELQPFFSVLYYSIDFGHEKGGTVINDIGFGPGFNWHVNSYFFIGVETYVFFSVEDEAIYYDNGRAMEFGKPFSVGLKVKMGCLF